MLSPPEFAPEYVTSPLKVFPLVATFVPLSSAVPLVLLFTLFPDPLSVNVPVIVFPEILSAVFAVLSFLITKFPPIGLFCTTAFVTAVIFSPSTT